MTDLPTEAISDLIPSDSKTALVYHFIQVVTGVLKPHFRLGLTNFHKRYLYESDVGSVPPFGHDLLVKI